MQEFHHIGTKGKPWANVEKSRWLESCSVKRSYKQEVLDSISVLADRFEVVNYGALTIDPKKYPLIALKTKDWSTIKPSALITGGVHGYETSGVQGALAFLAAHALEYSSHFNILVFPCISPWGYETINRWNPNTIDPNRSFYHDSPSEEAAAVIQLLKSTNTEFVLHIDLHETTDTDESEFRPALAARDGVEYISGSVPDGFYVVGDTKNPQADFQAAIIESVQHVTHIAPADSNGKIIGEPIEQEGVINYPFKTLSLCAGVTNARFTSTTEVYPDSPKISDELCIEAQVRAISGALNFATKNIS